MFTTQSPYLPIYLSFSIWTHPFIYRSVTSETPASPGIFFFPIYEGDRKAGESTDRHERELLQGKAERRNGQEKNLGRHGEERDTSTGKKGERSREKGSCKV